MVKELGNLYIFLLVLLSLLIAIDINHLFVELTDLNLPSLEVKGDSLLNRLPSHVLNRYLCWNVIMS